MTLDARTRKASLRPSQVAQLQTSIVRTEEALLLAPPLPDDTAEQLRQEACSLVVDLQGVLQGVLHRLRKRMEPSETPAGPERVGSWMANAVPAKPSQSASRLPS